MCFPKKPSLLRQSQHGIPEPWKSVGHKIGIVQRPRTLYLVLILLYASLFFVLKVGAEKQSQKRFGYTYPEKEKEHEGIILLQTGLVKLFNAGIIGKIFRRIH